MGNRAGIFFMDCLLKTGIIKKKDTINRVQIFNQCRSKIYLSPKLCIDELQINKKKSGNVPLASSLPTIRSSLILRSGWSQTSSAARPSNPGTYLAQGSLPLAWKSEIF
jgi:hypothetical protein